MGVFIFGIIAMAEASPSQGYSDLSTFTTENYFTLDGIGKWETSGSENSMVTQTANCDPSIFRSGGSIDVGMKRITGDFLITGTDDDNVGFAFGYQNRGQMYLFGWKKQYQDPWEEGMYLSVLNTGSSIIDPARTDFGNLDGDSSNVRTILRENHLSWEKDTTYNFIIDFYAGQFNISILEGVNELESWSIVDSTFTSGDFGFFNSSQAGVTYGKLEVNAVPVPGAVWLFGSGLIGLLGFRRKVT